MMQRYEEISVQHAAHSVSNCVHSRYLRHLSLVRSHTQGVVHAGTGSVAGLWSANSSYRPSVDSCRVCRVCNWPSVIYSTISCYLCDHTVVCHRSYLASVLCLLRLLTFVSFGVVVFILYHFNTMYVNVLIL